MKIGKMAQKRPKMENGPKFFFQASNPHQKTQKMSIAKLNSVQCSGCRESFDDATFQKIKKMLQIPYLHFK